MNRPKLRSEALISRAGDFVNLVEPQSEADPAGLLFDYLAAFGNAAGPGPTFTILSDEHRPIIYPVLVGNTSEGRKGSSRSPVRKVFESADPEWHERCNVTGHASGEGLIADLARNQEATGDERLFVVEPEFSAVLRKSSREGAILSETFRNAWDGERLANRRSIDQVVVPTHHVSILGHTTGTELRRTLRTEELFNGFVNRFVWVSVARSKRLPHGGHLSDEDWEFLSRTTADALHEAQRVGGMYRSRDADAIWQDWYMTVPHPPGIWGAATTRREPMVLRLSMIYALMDGSAEITDEHLMAAIAAWDYCDASAAYIFGDKTGDKNVDKLIEALREAKATGLTASDQKALYGGHSNPAESARTELIREGRAVEIKRSTGGRPAVVLVLNEHAPTNHHL